MPPMPQAQSNQLIPENRFPDCVFMKLHSEPVRSQKRSVLGLLPQSATKSPQLKQVDLKLTIRFGKQTIQCPGGTVQFGLKRGELKLKLENSRIPLEKIGLKASFAKTVEVEEQQEKGRESEATLAVAGGVKTKNTGKTATKSKFMLDRVTNHGLEEEPAWEFEGQGGAEPVLQGQLTEELLGTIELMGHPCCLRATFEIRGRSDIHLFDSDGLLRAKNLSRNKTAWATQEFFLRFIAPKLQPHISQVEGHL